MERLKHIVQINILLGAWLIVAPFILGYSGSPAESAVDIAVGVVIISCSWWILAAMRGRVGASAIQILGGLWLMAAPFYFHYVKMSRVFANDLIAGLLIAIVGATATGMIAARLRRPA